MKQLDPKAFWMFFVQYIFAWIVLMMMLTPVILIPIREGGGAIMHWGWWLGPIVLLVLFVVYAKLTYKFYKYELREDSFRKEHGVISKRYVTIPYDRIQNVDIYRGVIARLLGLSDLHIQTAGTSAPVAMGEGRLPGLSKEVAEQLRDELILRARQSKHQGL